MPQLNDQSRSHTALKQDCTLIAVLEMSQSAWLVAGLVPGIERPPLKKIEPGEAALLRLLRRWQEEATKAGYPITRITLAFEAGRDGFWLARWLRARGIEAHVIHPTSVAVSREHRRAKTDRLDTALLKRAFLGWLRGERGHCSMAEIPTLEEEDAKRPTREREGLVRERTRLVNRIKGALARLGIRGFKPTLRQAPERLSALRLPEGAPLPPHTLAELRRDMARLRFVLDQIREIEAARLDQLEQHPETGAHTMVRLLARILGVGIETADMLVHEVLSRNLRDRRAVARSAGLTGAPDESGGRRREKGLAKAGNARVRRGMIPLAWRFLRFQPNSALTRWYRARTADARGATRKTMIVALARKLLIALWRLVRSGEPLEGVVLRPAA
jgi:transposase